MISNGYSLNLTLTDYHDPAANHILDAEVVGDVLIVSAMVQGIEFYDISNNGTLNHLDNFTLGQGIKANCVRAADNYAYFTTYNENGVFVVNISNPNNPQSLGSINNTGNLLLENLDLEGNTLAVCAHEDGVLLFDISNPASPVRISDIETNNAWAVALAGGYAYISDDENILIVNVNDIHSPSFINQVQTTNAVKDLVVYNNYLYAALGSDGVDIYDLVDPQNPQYLDNYNTTTMAHRIALSGNKLAVADWDDVEVLEWNGESLNRIGYKNTGIRTSF